MNVIRKKFNTKYLYHYTKKENIDKIIKDKKFKSIDKYTFFTGSLNECITNFETEMMSYKYYIDLDLKLKEREYSNKEEFVILKVPYVEDNNFYEFNFSNSTSIYSNSIAHKGCYDFKKIKIIDFPKERKYMFKSLLAKIFVSISLMTPLSVLADSWTDSPNYNTAWYNEVETSYIINNEAELAGLAYLVNENGVTFEGKTITVNSNMSLINHDWELISDIFKGNVDGAHRILLQNRNSELFANENNYEFTYAYYYPAKLYSSDGNSHDIFLTSDETIENFKTELINNSMYSNDSILVYEGNVLDNGTIEENNIEENGKLYAHEGTEFFKLDNGEYFGIDCELEDSIATIKNTIQSEKSIDVERMKIYFGNVELENEKTLNDYHISEKSILLLKLKNKIEVKNDVNGTTTIDKVIADEGEIITIVPNPNDNYSTSEIKIYNDDNEDITTLVNYANNKFTMPAYSVSINVKYEIINPQTYDSITPYVIISISSIFGWICILLSKLFKNKIFHKIVK